MASWSATIEFGNAYYRTRGGAIDPALGFERRWVIYNGVSEASMTPPGWNGWLHHTVDVPPTRKTTSRIRGNCRTSATRPAPRRRFVPTARRFARDRARPSSGDYEAWSPGP